MPEVELKENYYFIRVLAPEEFKEGSLRTDDVGRLHHTLRIVGIRKSTGKYTTQAWRLHKDDVVIRNGVLSGKTLGVQRIIQSLRSNS